MKSVLMILLALGVLGLMAPFDRATAAPCTPSGTTTITLTGSNCTLPSTVYGVDVAATSTDTTNTGGVVVPAGSIVTLTSADTLVYGSSISVSGSITKVSGAQIRKGALWVTDADNDRYGASGTLQFSTTRPGTKIRWGYTHGAATYTYDANDVSSCPQGQTMGCTYCLNGAVANVTNGTDPYSACDTANTGCANGCIAIRRTGMCNGSGACATTNANVSAGQLCSGAGTITTAQCQSGYNCNGLGRCCYTDIYGEHCAW